MSDKPDWWVALNGWDQEALWTGEPDANPLQVAGCDLRGNCWVTPEVYDWLIRSFPRLQEDQ